MLRHLLRRPDGWGSSVTNLLRPSRLSGRRTHETWRSSNDRDPQPDEEIQEPRSLEGPLAYCARGERLSDCGREWRGKDDDDQDPDEPTGSHIGNSGDLWGGFAETFAEGVGKNRLCLGAPGAAGKADCRGISELSSALLFGLGQAPGGGDAQAVSFAAGSKDQ